MQTEQLIKKYGTTPENRMLVTRLCELASRAYDRGVPQYSVFLSPAERAVCACVKELSSIVDITFDGGYETAERSVAVLTPRDCPYKAAPPIAALALNYKGEHLSHRDILGSIMGLGIKREKIGDILADAQPPMVLCDSVIAQYIIDHIERAGRNRIAACFSSLSDIPAPSTTPVTCSVKSLRLDTIVAEGFSISRPQAADAVQQGLVQLNWLVCTSGGKTVVPGDNITMRGKGKITVGETGGTSRKGRVFVTIHRYI